MPKPQRYDDLTQPERRACHLTGARADQVREALARRGITYLPKAS